MLYDIIPSRNIDYSFYVKCDCGKELLHFTYYAETTNCEEIISVKYYGPSSEKGANIFTFTLDSLRNLSDNLRLSLSEQTYTFVLHDGCISLYVTKDNLGFYTIKRTHHKISLMEDWEICIRDFTVETLIIELNNMHDKIIDIRKQI